MPDLAPPAVQELVVMAVYEEICKLKDMFHSLGTDLVFYTLLQ